ncbi:hypothetical protein FCV82_07855 [Vibrio breoganii]|uniref:hypothetical protein n=1 Tax=Vibrio breoganii TaxID=553239 RepID=UPI0010BD5DE0|nr:hypothetical protein [Vibrio breoganii]TKF88194.1 hypothetical protein FCV82_07855 [Vibrio breoganii]
MKMRILTATIIALSGVGAANALDLNIDPNGSNTGEIQLIGEIEKKCVLDLSKFNGQAQVIDLSYPAKQTAGRSIVAWCNNYVAPLVTFESANDWNLVSDSDEAIPYNTWMDGSGDLSLLSGVPLPDTAFVTQTKKGETWGRPIRYTPVVNGFETAGTYTDTITVTFEPN